MSALMSTLSIHTFEHSSPNYPTKKKNAPASAQVRLVGVQAVGLGVSWCMYGHHAPTAMCDYCVASACLRALLRLLSLPLVPPVLPAAAAATAAPPAGAAGGAANGPPVGGGHAPARSSISAAAAASSSSSNGGSAQQKAAEAAEGGQHTQQQGGQPLANGKAHGAAPRGWSGELLLLRGGGSAEVASRCVARVCLGVG